MENQQNDEESVELDPESASFRCRQLLVVPVHLFSMVKVRRIDLSSNELTRFPGSRVGQGLPCLEVLKLSNNMLHVLEDILALASAPRLCELDVRDNPLRLRHNRLYLLESLLFHDTAVDEDILRELNQDERLKTFTSSSQPPRATTYRSRLPRRRGFPMLQMLNGDWITDSESRQVELEHGKPLEYFRSPKQNRSSTRAARKHANDRGVLANKRRFDGSRMTIKQMLRNEARITAIPLPQMLKRYQIDAETCEESVSRINETEPWNYPISTFDDLQSDERQYIRYKSKHVAGTMERDDHFFESTTFLDCVAQCERSRRLTIRAVDLLTQPLVNTMDMSSSLVACRMNKSTKSAPALPISAATAALTDNLTANFSKQQALESFHVALRHKTNQLLSGQTANEIRWRENAHGIEASLEESLSKVKLRNAVDLANTLEGSKEQKRLLQALIDSDTRVIEEERVMEEHKSHRQRLRRINARQVVNFQARPDVELAKKFAKLHAESPWQERNWKSKMKALERKRHEGDLSEATPSHFLRGKKIQQGIAQTNSKPLSPTNFSASTKSPNADSVTQVMAKFRTIETVEKAAQDPLVEINSHDLLVRCSEIRQNKDKHIRALRMYRDRFREEETEWEHMRQDPINLVRQHLRRKLYQDVQQIQVGNMEYVYSPLFQ
ncbi:hypothetical protein PHMEG_0003017 [Phytophthora megakarya]|uniref:Uncharacterized protein n=1 Tax=Phytophthora megakarya TaxID=4795 RepID=A0A225WX62_9STRA|nr:hypothetical protein PHMEG_0003017 [Phytophthora megakarya]